MCVYLIILFLKQVVQHHDFFLDKCLRECLLLLPEVLKVSLVFIGDPLVLVQLPFGLILRMVIQYYISIILKGKGRGKMLGKRNLVM